MNIQGRERVLTELDHVRLASLSSRGLRERSLSSQRIDAVLEDARVVPSRRVGADIVTMYSQVELVDLDTRRRQTLTVCFPGDSEPSAGFISVLSPVGSGLLGLKVGAVARWQMPGGEEGAAEIVAIAYQPEASGDYTR